MNKTLKRALSGAVYVAIMWFGTSFQGTFHILFFLILLLSLYEMYKLRKGKTSFISYLYVIIPLSLIHKIDTELILFIFILTWTFDTFAYLVGVKFGKHKILPSVSPKKSWEGFFGGFIFTIIASYITYNYFDIYFDFSSIKLPLIIIMSIILPFTATIGDFIESHYKREAGVKDSGNFIPGHGGILDRMDAFMISIPILYILINLYK
ncbi:MAG: phosphatidate cytidylyltransferase [Flavobacteriales bacterium]|jgi:phosphatidate cytidylyltransferase|nr:phosphatidate cytidylyltransferase [Flavobacteriales bacterium]MBT5699433.1 phosphatidate cytidylyltransferase [Flavobacteriales bacterium]MBT6698961.1 phosphatidate cytidylyltransferase [Flavobacteriales bacterium]MBT6815148.1 phosphatidate cytidylyltransferase [Flavobacteriales bacterium]MBT7726034.1 phosphatidate cytidylyltransferase [Flavobacteriales bacterium]